MARIFRYRCHQGQLGERVSLTWKGALQSVVRVIRAFLR
jgi:hypothetical protein